MNPIDSLAPGDAERARALAADLVHDVGKRVARTARNVAAGAALPAELRALALSDLYADAERPSARDLFEPLAGALEALVDDARIAQARQLLAAIARSERRIRGGDDAALDAALGRARILEELLRSIARELDARLRALQPARRGSDGA